MTQRLGRSHAANSRFFLCSRLALTARGHMPRPAASSHCLAPPPPLLSLRPPLPASQGTLPLPPPFAAGLHEECAPVQQFRAGRSRALGDVDEDDDLLLPQSRVLLHARDDHGRVMPERRRPRNRRRPDPLHATPISTENRTKSHPAPVPPFAHPPPPTPPSSPHTHTQLCSPSVSAAFSPKQRKGAPCHEPLQRRQTSRPARPPSRFHTNARLPRRLAPFLGSVGVDAGGKRRRVPGGGERKWISGLCARW